MEGLLVALAGAALVVYAFSIPPQAGWSSWPGLSLAGAGMALAAIGLGMAYGGRRRPAPAPGAHGPVGDRRSGWVVGLTVLCVAAWGRLPFEVVAGGFLGAIWAMVARRRWLAGLAAAGCVVGLSVVLQGLFSVMLPGGSLLSGLVRRGAAP